jgi:CheY-like chemotaxis protein
MAHLESLVILDVAGRSGAALAFGFERAGLRAYATRDPDDAFSMAKTRVPHLVVVAVDAGRDGNEELALIGRLREEEETRQLPIVAVGEQARREEALRAGADEYVTRPAFIRDVLTLSRLAVAVKQDGDTAGVVGMLEDYGLYFLVRALAVAGRSCVLELERGSRQGEVHLAKGVIVAARAGRMSGVAALQHLMLWGEAAMSVRFESPAGERKIATPVDELLGQGGAFVREFERLASRVGGAQAIYAQEPRRAAEAQDQIPVEVMALVRQYDGQKPLIDIVEDSPFKPFDTIKITYRLAELGAILRKPEPRDVAPLSTQLAVRDWLLGAEAREENAPRGEARGVTEAGRRAAEAYAAEAARRESEPSPGDDLLNDTIPTPRVEPEQVMLPSLPEPAAPREPMLEPAHEPRFEAQDDAPREPMAEAPTQRAVPKGRKRKNSRTSLPKAEAHASKPEAHEAKPAAKVESAKTEARIESKPHAKVEAPKTEAKPAAKVEHKPAHAEHKHGEHKPAAHAEHKHGEHKPAHGETKPNAKVAAGKKHETLFDELEEDFFAREKELAGAPTVDNFDDLDSGKPHAQNRKPPPKRPWFNFRNKK